MSNEDSPEEKVVHRSNGPGSPPLYKPPPQFKEINTPPLLSESLPHNAELWLVRIQDNQLKADEFKGKRVSLALNAFDSKMGCFEDSKGSSFEILDLHNVAGVQPFAFLPNGDSSLEVRRVSRQVAIVRSLDPVTLSRPCSSMDRHLSSEPDGISNVRTSHKQKPTFPILNEGISSRGTGSETKQDSHAVSASLSTGLGCFSTVESLQEDEERISLGKLGKPSKKSKRDQSSLNSDVDLSPLASSHKDLKVHGEQASSQKKSRKHKKITQEESG